MSMNVELPDMEEMIGILDRIYETSVEISRLEIFLKQEEAKITKESQVNPIYFQNGKPPSQTYVDNAYKFTGFSNELVQHREALANLEATLWRLKGQLDINKALIDIWRTQAANERTSFG